MADRAGPGPEGGNAHEPAHLAAFLVALRAKGETAAELSGMLDALMDRVIPLPADGQQVTDVVGTGGDGAHTVPRRARTAWTSSIALAGVQGGAT